MALAFAAQRESIKCHVRSAFLSRGHDSLGPLFPGLSAAAARPPEWGGRERGEGIEIALNTQRLLLLLQGVHSPVVSSLTKLRPASHSHRKSTSSRNVRVHSLTHSLARSRQIDLAVQHSVCFPFLDLFRVTPLRASERLWNRRQAHSWLAAFWLSFRSVGRSVGRWVGP